MVESGQNLSGCYFPTRREQAGLPPARMVRVSAPSVLPVSHAEIRAHLRVDHHDDDALLDLYLQTATAILDGPTGFLGRALITQTWRMDAPSWGYPLAIPLAPVQSITSVAYWDADNADATLDPSAYTLRTDGSGSALYTAPSMSWPSAYWRVDAVRVTLVAGYGDNPADVPAPIRHAIMLLVAHWYANREAAGDSIPLGVQSLLSPFRVFA